MRFRGFALAMIILMGQQFAAAGTIEISAEAYADRLRGMWIGELLGNYAGRPQEGHCSRGGSNYTIDWNAVSQTNPWCGDDDTVVEYLYAGLLQTTPNPTNAQVGQLWADHIDAANFYIANKQAAWLIGRGATPPDSGSIHNNMHWYAIDSQITTESLGAIAVGMRQQAADLAGQFASASNDGYALHAAQFYAAMYAAAPFQTDVATVVAKGLDVVPRSSRTYQVIQDVRDWAAADMASAAPDWRHVQTQLYDKYCADSTMRYQGWVESTVNVGMTTLSLLYGGGDMQRTIEIGVQGGFDADCNPATAGGVIGLMKGYSALPAGLTGAMGDNYAIGGLKNMPPGTTITQVVQTFQQAAEAQILRAGGTITGTGSSRMYAIPSDDALNPLVEKPDPAGAAGLVGRIKQLGGQVSATANQERHGADDRENIDTVIDGIADVSYNGHIPYAAWSSPRPAGSQDYYQINFDRQVHLRSVVFYEGDILWDGVNSDPAADTPRAGYFTDLAVQVRRGGQFVTVSGLHLSEPLDALKFYQRIEMTFDPTSGDAVRIIGTAGGTEHFTTCTELEAYGSVLGIDTLAGDADCNNVIDGIDLAKLAQNWNPLGGGEFRGWEEGDFNGDGRIDGIDLAAMAQNWSPLGYTAGQQVPEPATMAVLTLGGLALARRRR